jgi:site-specific recombinase XerD
LQKYSDYMRMHLSPASIQSKLYTLLAFHEFLVRKLGRDLEQLRSSDIQEYLAELALRKEKGQISQGHIHRSAIHIKKFAKWLKREGIINPEEYSKIKEDLSDVPNEIGEDNRLALSDEEKQQISERLTLPLHKQIIWTGLNFGLRRQEYSRLRTTHLELDIDRPRLKIELSKGHNRKTRYIPLFPSQVNQWRRWLKFIASMNLPHDYVFFSFGNPKAGGLTDDKVNELFSRMTKISKVHLYSHRLRYTYAVTLWKHGVDIFVISRLLGHSSVETTIRYLKVREEEFYKKFEEQTKGLFH